MPTMLYSQEPRWPADWLEDVDTCLWCKGSDLAPHVDGVRDWFFGAVPGEFAISRCNSCASLVLRQRPVADQLGKAYAGYYTHGGEAEAALPRGLVQKIGRGLAEAYARGRYGRSRRLADTLGAGLFTAFQVRRAEVDANHRHLPRLPGKVLDFGCGNGDFLVRAAALGHGVVGVDFDPEAADYVRQRGIAVCAPEALADASFDLVTAAHVIEHVADPLALLRDFRRWLKPGGQLFIEVPNAGAAGLAAHGRFWRGLEAPRHFSLPSATALQRALSSAGFAPVTLGQRAFSRGFMDTASRGAALANGGADQLAAPDAAMDGPDILTCVARAC